MKQILFATSNSGKLKEVKNIFQKYDIDVLSLNDLESIAEVEENGKIFLENATIKAKYYFEYFKIPVIADDSGLCVEVLDNAPGVFSARYANATDNKLKDEMNIKKLLDNLKSFDKPSAFFETSMVYYSKDKIINVKGILKGYIIKEKKGSNGFGYDPIFVPQGYDKTLAEMTLDEKNKISHRSQALANLKQYFDEIFN